MKISAYVQHADGIYRPLGAVHQERLSFETWKSIHGGNGIISKPKDYFDPPEGFSLWLTKRGEVVAIKADI